MNKTFCTIVAYAGSFTINSGYLFLDPDKRGSPKKQGGWKVLQDQISRGVRSLG